MLCTLWVHLPWDGTLLGRVPLHHQFARCQGGGTSSASNGSTQALWAWPQRVGRAGRLAGGRDGINLTWTSRSSFSFAARYLQPESARSRALKTAKRHCRPLSVNARRQVYNGH